MNVVIISPEFPPKSNWGGVATFNNNLAQLLTTLNYKVHVITYDGLGSEEITLYSDRITIHYVRFKTDYKIINALYFKFFTVIRYLFRKFLPTLLFSLDWNFFSLFLFKKLQKRYSYKLIFSPTYNAPSLFISLIFPKIPIVISLQGPQEDLNRFEVMNVDRKIRAWLENKYMIHFSAKIVVCSKYLYDITIARFPKIKKKTKYVHNFINTDSYKNEQVLNKKNIVFFGRLEYRKGVDILVKAFTLLAKKNKDLKLWLIGESGGYFKDEGSLISFSDWFNKLKIPKNITDRIFIINQIDQRNALIQLLIMLKGVAVFPSRYEPFGFVHTEAMSTGYLVIVSHSGAGPEIINDGVDGFLSYPNLKSLLINLNRVLALNEVESFAMSQRAVSKANATFDVSSVKPKFSEIIKEIITSKPIYKTY